MRFMISIPESFDADISHQVFYYKITFVNSQHEITISKEDFVPKNVIFTKYTKTKSYSDLVCRIQLISFKVKNYLHTQYDF